jgi:twinkle protein
MKTFHDFGIEVPPDASGDVKTTCPKCSHTRKKQSAPCLSVNIPEGVWNCWHCGWTGSLKTGAEKAEPKPKKIVKPSYDFSKLGLAPKVLEYFKARGISEKALADNQVGYGPAWMPGPNSEVGCLQFPYLKGGQVVNIKFRDGQKNFRQAKDAEKCLYRFDEIERRAAKDRTLIICEGEMDVLALVTVGYNAVTSVPDGAPSPDTKNYEKKFSFLESAEDLLAKYGKVVLCVDNDAPGQTLERELARRIGFEKCYRVSYPEGCKDINEVLVKHGKDTVAQVIAGARPMPIAGLYTSADIAGDVELLYKQGFRRGLSTGWPTVDEFYTVRTGEMTIITGIPGSGKSNWLDALTANLFQLHGWSFCFCSPENWPVQRHAASIMEKLVKKPFALSRGNLTRMTPDEVEFALAAMDGAFNFIMLGDDEMSLGNILAKARAAIFRHGVKGVVLDPWNELEHSRPSGLSETEFISQALSKVRRFARVNDVHVWIVAHPTKLQKDRDTGEYPVPTLYDISGSAHWYNKADNGITVYRHLNEDLTDIYVGKIRFREVGQRGKATLAYSRDAGIYHEVSNG